MTLQGRFDQFKKNIEPTDNQRNKIIETHIHLRQNILNRLPYVKNTMLTGSYIRRTLIRPMNDVDVFVILNYYPGAFGIPNPQSILNKLKSNLNSSYPNSEIRQDKPCIVLDFSHCKFELTPAIEGNTWGGTYYEIPNPNNILVWKRIDSPNILKKQLAKANSTNPLLIPLIKMMKKCKDYNKLKSPRSYELEILAIQHLGYISNYREGVIRLLQIYGWLNPSEISNMKYMNDTKFGEYCRATLFGPDFPK